MGYNNHMNLKFLSLSENESFARLAVASFCSMQNISLDEIADIKTAVSEAVTNCIVHAYADCVGKIYIHSVLCDGSVIKIKIRDKGCGIADVKQARVPLFTTSGGERAGLGFAVMESFCDKLYVRSKVGCGTTVTLIKKIGGRAEND